MKRLQPAAGLVLFLLGCATVREARQAQESSPLPAGERTLMAAEVGLSSTNTLTLDQALGIADRFHPAVMEARQNLAAAAAQVTQVRAGGRPQLEASAGYRRGTSNTAGQPGGNTSDDLYTAGLGLDYLVYDFGKTPALVQAALARQLAAEETLRSVRSEVAYGVRNAFYNLGLAMGLMNVAEETKRQYEVRLLQVQGLVEVGRRIKYDITKAQVELGNAKLALINANNAVVSSRAALNRALGLAEEPGYRVAEPPPEELNADLPALMQLARERQPALRALQAQVVAASAGVDVAIADLYPALRVSGNYSWSGAVFPLVWNWSAAAQTALNLFDGGTRNARILESVAQLRAARARQAAQEQQMFADLSQAVARLDGARQRVTLGELQVQQAQESLVLVSERYRLGRASLVEQADAAAALATARAEQVKARFDLLNSIAAIRRTIGEP